ncbi:MAG: DNA internalization-related competence protein ComEC/Rec2 [Bacilli bacterium]|nr:DNA internalization-related competence protein ComEC/Rec2 [Bacilli bacterium]MDD4719058.1 DNA internalization-related competence protein ComEC/Rec2 [Bacilli bacterium]
MLSLKTLLQSKWPFVLILSFALLNTVYVLNKQIYKTYYNGSETNVIGYITDININGNHIKVTLNAKEKLIVNYYANTEDELVMLKDNYLIGDYIRVEGVLDVPKSNTIFNLFNYKKYLFSQKIYWVFNSTEIEKINQRPKFLYLIKRKIIKRIESVDKSSAYLKNYLIAERSDINDFVLNSYQGNGLNHLLTLSGAQISMFSMIVLFLINKISKNKIINYIIVTIIMLFYLFLAGSPPSLLRAVMMFIFLRINEVFKLKINTLNFIILIFSTLLIYNPYYVYHLGFLFSFSISFYLILFKDVINRYKTYFKRLFVISIIAFLVSMPILINNFFEINLLTPITNLIFIPIFLLIIFPLSIVVFFIPILDQLLYLIITFTENLSLFVNNINVFDITLKYMGIIPVIVYYVLITIVLISFRNKKYLNFIYISVVLIIHFFSPYFNEYPVITFIDVGQGDSTLIELPKNIGNILIDTGGIIKYNNEEWKQKNKDYSIAVNKIIPYLKSRGIRKLDYLILTHGDYDHMGESENLINNFKIDNVILNSGNNNDYEKNLIKLLNNKKIPYNFYNKFELIINKYKFYFLNQKNIIDENEDSLIVYTKLNNMNILLTGDAGKSSEKYLIDTYKLPNMDILKLGHHGSKNSSSREFINELIPKFAIISVGLNNRYNHPHKEVIDILNDYHIKYYITSTHGSIKIILKKQLLIKTCL